MRLRHLNLWEAVVPHDLRRAVWRRGLAIAGAGLMLTAWALALALATWSAQDPSLDHATAAAPQNWLGLPGAIAADLLMQFLGLAAGAVVLVIGGWGWYLASGRAVPRPLRRLGVAILVTALAAGLLAGLPTPDSWQLAAGLGGVIGDAVGGLVSVPLGAAGAVFGAEIETGLAALVVVGTVLALAYAAGLSVHRPKSRKRAARRTARPREADRHDGEDGEDAFEPLSIWPAVGLVLTWSWRALAITGQAARALWRRLFSARDDERQSRLRIAMARANADDVTWADPAQIYAPQGRSRLNPRAATPESAEAAPPPGPASRALDYMRELFGFDRQIDLRVGGPSEPRLLPDQDDESDAAAEPSPAGGRASPRKRKRAAPPAPPEPFPDTEYELPPLTLLNAPPERRAGAATAPELLEENARMLEGVLDDFGVRGEIINARPGPVVTLYELEPAPGIKSSRVISLADDIARSMSAISARVAVVPGRNAIGIELPNVRRQTVFLSEVLASATYADTKHKLPLTLGKNIGGEPVVADLARMPHLLIAGTTGSGKSVGINAMILSILFRLEPEHCKLIMIDPKMLELSVYDGIPHLLSPVVTDPKKAVVALKWTVREMETRYKHMSKLGVRNIDGYNTRVREAAATGEILTRTVQTGFDRETGQAVYETEEMTLEPMPYIVVVVDEMADLMIVAGKDIEGAIQRLAQMARAAGIHIIMATQRPSVDVITGTIKANFPTRISFQVTSKIDSRTILGEQGAEQLLGQGDMLYMVGGGRIGRVHGAFVSDEEVESVVQFLKRQGVPEYLDAVTTDTDDDDEASGGFDFGSGDDGEETSLYDQAVAIVARDRKASTSYIQRRLSIGYNRAATIIERMEQEGVVGPANHAGKREILVPEPSFEA